MSSNRISEEITELIITRNEFSALGGKKLRDYLIHEGHLNLPCVKTFNRLLKNFKSVRKALEEVFRTYGLPDAMTMDNGSPWKGSYPFRLSKLTVWLMRLGIKVSHSTPYHPQTQGKDERFHRTLKDEILKFYQFSNLQDCQKRFDEWRQIYNHKRPHEGISLKRPIDRYIPSIRSYPEKLKDLEYPEMDDVRKVGLNGLINFKGKRYFVGEHLGGQCIGIKEVEGFYDIYFATTKVKRIYKIQPLWTEVHRLL